MKNEELSILEILQKPGDYSLELVSFALGAIRKVSGEIQGSFTWTRADVLRLKNAG